MSRNRSRMHLALRGLIIVGVLVGAQLAVAPVTQAAKAPSVEEVADPSALLSSALLLCDEASGDIQIDPAFTLLPTTVTIEGTAGSDSCEGSGAAADITGATADVTGTIVGAICVPLLNTFVGTLNAGSMEVTWAGGPNPGTTTFSWTIPASIQIGPSTSVLALVGYSVAGRFHIPTAPATAVLILTLGNPSPDCPGTNSIEITDATIALLDVA